MKPIAELRDYLDKQLARVIAHNNVTPTCGKGCFHCCREPVYAQRQEVRDIVSAMTNEERDRIKSKVRTWLTGFAVNGFGDQHRPKADKYRSCFLWCPLLAEDGSCSVYDRRPIECRLHLARGPRLYCEDDKLRSKQEFIMPEGLIHAIMTAQVCALQDGESLTWDHLGILLAEELLGEEFPTASRFQVQRQGQKAVMITEAAKPA